MLLNVSLPRHIFNKIRFENELIQNVKKKHCFANGRILFYILLKIFDKLNEPHVKIVIRKSFVAPSEQSHE